MGGSGAHEYMAPCAAGENEVALAPGYAANVEVASAQPQPVELPPGLDEPRAVPTPGPDARSRRSPDALGVPEGAALKAIPVVASERGFVLTLVRGDHRLNEIKLANALGEEVRQATAEEITEKLGPPGFIGPVGAEVPVIKDAAIAGRGLLLRRQPPRRAPDRGRAGPGLQLRGAGHPRGRGRRHLARRRSDRDRACDRDREHLQARHPLLRAARCDLPRRERQGAARS